MLTTSPITGSQSKAARTYLDWTQEDLAHAAGLDRSTIRTFEGGFTPRRESLLKIRKALEQHGIEFTDDDGVKRRGREVKVYLGKDSRDAFYNDVVETVHEQHGDIHCIARSQEVFMRFFGSNDEDTVNRLRQVTALVDIKCITANESLSSSIAFPKLHFRATSNNIIRPDHFIRFGRKYTTVIEYSRTDFGFIVFEISENADFYRERFMSMWADATPLRNRNSYDEEREILSAYNRGSGDK